MPRKPSFSLAYTHESAFAAQMAQTFAVPAGLPRRMQAILDQLDHVGAEPKRPLADRLEALRQLAESESDMTGTRSAFADLLQTGKKSEDKPVA